MASLLQTAHRSLNGISSWVKVDAMSIKPVGWSGAAIVRLSSRI